MIEKTFILDGGAFDSLEGLFLAVGAALQPDRWPGHDFFPNLDALNDVLCWPVLDDGTRYTLVWRNSDESRRRLGHAETVRQLEVRGVAEFPGGQSEAVSRLEDAQRGVGPTVFDWVLEIMRSNSEYLDVRLE
jgi:hypothetical protein